MKKFIIKSFCFTLFFVVFFILINVLYAGVILSTDWNFIKRFESLKFDKPDFELLILGASLPQDDIDAEFLTLNGIKSYNTSIDGSSIKTNYVQLKEYLTNYTKKPKYVLLAVNSRMVQSFDDELIHPIVDVTTKGYKFGVNDVPILRFKWLGFEFIKKIISKNHRHARLLYGQVKFQGIGSDYTHYTNSYLNIKEFEASKWIGETAKLCNQNGIKLLVLEMPGYKNIQNITEIGPYTLHFHNGDSARLYNFNSRDFCRIFDANKDWIGNSHLNEYGAAKFTSQLLQIIKSDYKAMDLPVN